VRLDKDDPIHLFDSHNLEIIFTELDTFYDFVSYLSTKELAISRLTSLSYCGEEDILADYFMNFNEHENEHFIGTQDKEIDGVFIVEGHWQEFIQSGAYKRRKQANKLSYAWDTNGKQKPAHPYLLLVDLNMPRMNGIQLVQAIRKDKDLRHSIVFMLTTSKRDEDKIAAYDFNVAGYIVKEKAGDDFLKLASLVDSYWRIVELP